jgi:hypothetical protein
MWGDSGFFSRDFFRGKPLSVSLRWKQDSAEQCRSDRINCLQTSWKLKTVDGEVEGKQLIVEWSKVDIETEERTRDGKGIFMR